MARLDSKDNVNLIKLLGNLIEDLNSSIERGVAIKRENDIKRDSKLDPNRYTNKQSVVIKKGQENLINSFITNVAQRQKAAAMGIDLLTTENKLIKFGSLSAPTNVSGNLGDIAEGVFAAALAARFINRNKQTDAASVKNIIRSLSVNAARNTATFTGTAPNVGISGQDVIRLTIVLKPTNMNFLTNPANIEALSQYITASIQYADRQVVREWVNTIYYNRRIDTVEVKADGVSDSRSTKIDVQVKITNDKGILKGVNINVSLKVDDSALFGQVSGGEFSAVSTFFSTAIQENMLAEQQQFQTKTSGAKKMEYIYRQAAEKLKSKLKLNPQGTKSIIGSGIKQFATRDNAGVVDENGNTVELIDLNRGEATIYDFKNVSQKLLNYNFDVKFNVGKSGLPTIVIEEAESNKTLIQLRSMVQNLKDAKGRPYLYYRNYVEKGAFLKELIGSSANENPVTSS